MAQGPAGSFSISDIFRGSGGREGHQAAGTPAPAPATAPGSSGMPNQPNNPGADPANNLDLGGVSNTDALGPDGKPKKAADPLDSFTELFTLTEADRKKVPADPFAEPLLTFDPKKFGETAGRMNFASSLTPELVQKALAGDVQSFTAALNKVAQSSFTASAQVLTGILEQAIKKNNGRLDGTLESKFRNLQLNNQRSSNPALQHPAAQPMLEALKATIATKNPTMRSEEVTAKAEEYFSTLADSMLATRKKSSDDKDGSNLKIDDWTNFLGGAN